MRALRWLALLLGLLAVSPAAAQEFRPQFPPTFSFYDEGTRLGRVDGFNCVGNLVACTRVNGFGILTVITPGADTEIIFNAAGTLTGSPDFTWSGTTLTLGATQATGLSLTGSTLTAIGAGADVPLTLSPKGEGALHLKVDGNVGTFLQTLYIGPTTTITDSPIPFWGPGIMFADDFDPIFHMLGPFPGINFWKRLGSNLVPTKVTAGFGLFFIAAGGYTGAEYDYRSELDVRALYDWDVGQEALWQFLYAAIGMNEIAAPPVSATGNMRLYLDSTSKTLKLSLDAGAYSDLVTAASLASATLPASLTTLTLGTRTGTPAKPAVFTSAGVLAEATTLGVPLGGTGAATLTGLVLGNGASPMTAYPGATCTNEFVRSLTAAGVVNCDPVDLATDITGILLPANGGTGNGFTAFTGPATSTKTFTLPNASATILTTNAAVTAAQGGTGQASYATGDLLYASSASALSKLAVGADGQVLTLASGLPSWAAGGGGSGTVTHTAGALTASALVVGNAADDVKVLASLGTTTTVLHGNAAGLPTFGAVSLTADVSGVLPYANGGRQTTGSLDFPLASGIPADGTGSVNTPALAVVRVSSGTQPTNGPKVTILGWQFDAATDAHVLWSRRMPTDYVSGGTLKLQFEVASLQSGTLKISWKLALSKVTPGSARVDNSVFPTIDTCIVTLTNNEAAGTLKEASCALSATALNSVVAGDFFTLFVGRDADNATNDTMTGNANLLSVSLDYVR